MIHLTLLFVCVLTTTNGVGSIQVSKRRPDIAPQFTVGFLASVKLEKSRQGRPI